MRQKKIQQKYLISMLKFLKFIFFPSNNRMKKLQKQEKLKLRKNENEKQ